MIFKIFKDPELDRWVVKFMGNGFLVGVILGFVFMLVQDIKEFKREQVCCKCKQEVLQ
jgi:hypothetical protein